MHLSIKVREYNRDLLLEQSKKLYNYGGKSTNYNYKFH